jgi:hypothetical protein
MEGQSVFWEYKGTTRTPIYIDTVAELYRLQSDTEYVLLAGIYNVKQTITVPKNTWLVGLGFARIFSDLDFPQLQPTLHVTGDDAVVGMLVVVSATTGSQQTQGDVLWVEGDRVHMFDTTVQVLPGNLTTATSGAAAHSVVDNMAKVTGSHGLFEGLWLWKADHWADYYDKDGSQLAWPQGYAPYVQASRGLIVNSSHNTFYATFVEHAQANNIVILQDYNTFYMTQGEAAYYYTNTRDSSNPELVEIGIPSYKVDGNDRPNMNGAYMYINASNVQIYGANMYVLFQEKNEKNPNRYPSFLAMRGTNIQVSKSVIAQWVNKQHLSWYNNQVLTWKEGAWTPTNKSPFTHGACLNMNIP